MFYPIIIVFVLTVYQMQDIFLLQGHALHCLLLKFQSLVFSIIDPSSSVDKIHNAFPLFGALF